MCYCEKMQNKKQKTKKLTKKQNKTKKQLIRNIGYEKCKKRVVSASVECSTVRSVSSVSNVSIGYST